MFSLSPNESLKTILKRFMKEQIQENMFEQFGEVCLYKKEGVSVLA